MIIETLRANGHQAFFVGGCVRDKLMGREPKDWDIATSATPDEVIELFPDAITVGKQFGVVVVKGHEVATFRKEADHVGHKCTVTFSDIMADASRRDFTINAMYMDGDRILDFFGGQKDIEMNILRTVGKAERRFAEDPLRMLRAVRFAAQFNMTMSDDIVMNGALLRTISAERIRDELVKILRVGGLKMLSTTGLLAHILPEIEQLNEVEQDARHPEGNVFEHTCLVVDNARHNTVVMMAALLHDVGKFETQEINGDKISFINHEDSTLPELIMRRLKFDNATIDAVCFLVKNHMRMHKFFDMKKSKQANLMRHEQWNNLVLLNEADCLGSYKPINTEAFKAVNMPVARLSDRLVTGDDLLALGFVPGKEMGTVLRALEEAQREGIFDTKEKGLAFLETLC